MTEIKKRRATLFLLLELLWDITVFIDLELKLAIAEVRRKISSGLWFLLTGKNRLSKAPHLPRNQLIGSGRFQGS